MKKPKEELAVDQKIRRRTFISFGLFGLYAAGAYSAWRWLYKSPEEPLTITGGAHKPLRRALNKTEIFFRRLAFNENHLVKTYPKEMAAKNVRHNSDIGSEGVLPPEKWSLQVTKKNGQVMQISLDQIKEIPKTELVFDFKCVEGWDQISYWGGAKFADFIKHFGLDEEARLDYVGLETPDKQYYVGIDMPSAMHPQTILAYEMNDKPLQGRHGQPLRLIIPVKYGIKNLKRIGIMNFSNTRPRDYWAEQGYDYYSGL